MIDRDGIEKSMKKLKGGEIESVELMWNDPEGIFKAESVCVLREPADIRDFAFVKDAWRYYLNIRQYIEFNGLRENGWR